MTQPKIDWESLGKAAGEAEKHSRPGLVATRPREWKPNSGQLARSHDSMRRHHQDKALDKRLDAALGSVKPARALDGTRFCKCGCGGPVSPRMLYTPECKKRVKADRNRNVSPPRERKQNKRHEQRRPAVKKCPVCCDLPERREAVCKGCDRPWGKERIG